MSVRKAACTLCCGVSRLWSRVAYPSLCSMRPWHAVHAILRPGDREALKHDLRWACRPLQRVLKELNGWVSGSAESTYCGPKARRHAKGVLDVQESIGLEVSDYLSDAHPDWIDDIATETWNELGGW